MSRPGWDDYFLEGARWVATRASCPRKQVGAIVVLDNRIIATGYNGAPPGRPHCTEVGCLTVNNHCHRAIHAERNAIDHLPPHLLDQTAEMTLYTTITPCAVCRAYAESWGINRFVWAETYPKVLDTD